MAREVELATWRRDGEALPFHARRVVEKLFEAQTRKYQAERERLQTGKGVKTFARWNKQELYLNVESCERAKAASRQHLLRHPELWTVNSNELLEIVALQHLLWIDLEDLSLPPEERRSEDAFTGTDGAVCEQLLLDAPRELFVIDGVEFHFAREAPPELHRGDLDGNDLEILKRQFGDRVVAAIRVALEGAIPLVQLMRAVTSALSQSGLAHLEQACGAWHVAVSGGEQEVRFELCPHPGGPWDLELFVRKANFQQCIVYSQGANEDSSPRACSPSSFFLKSCRIRYSVTEDGAVQVDVLGITREHYLADVNGKPLLKGASTFFECLPLSRLCRWLRSGPPGRACATCCAWLTRRWRPPAD
eukprot:symbB.v1.2.017073.t1/scaffold1283.1/size126978/12